MMVKDEMRERMAVRQEIQERVEMKEKKMVQEWLWSRQGTGEQGMRWWVWQRAWAERGAFLERWVGA